MLTIKGDWLNDFLAVNGSFVSGHASFASRLGISGHVTIRFIMQGKHIVYFLAINPIISNYREEYLLAFKAGYINRLREIFSPLVQVFYFEDKEDFDLFYPNKEEFRQVTSERMAYLVSTQNEGFTKDIGSKKKINRTTNDNFQKWTRKHLSGKMTAVDLDAFNISGESPVFIELKRVDEPLDGWLPNDEGWLPRLNDIANFNAVNVIARLLKGTSITLAYDENSDKEIAYHRDITHTNWTFINGRLKIISPYLIANDLLNIKMENEPLYTSFRKQGN